MESNTTKIYRRTEEEWLQLIQECRTSGLSDKEWCRQNNIAISNFYYHIRQLTKKACQVPVNKRTASREHHEIVPLKVLDEEKAKDIPAALTDKTSFDTVPVRLSYHGTFLEIQNNAEQSTVENVLRALQSLC